ncbi:ATP-binding cassette domain-containing protein [Actinomycetospora termitidis]|uniref:ATP-binding cassette domain-containing protein n=1 Tax=Actinomycetospora termitidis TaxID=3053470 RepID=A0ABT7M5R7_9PSEU|nr:ATP-binding cassette domain-containing protein [Actinomycetospora sp. Odt1-22]MDL5156010.1 ATP-binding cassette domain-containing protein [Actinomycetospora sp. Odt1-22]
MPALELLDLRVVVDGHPAVDGVDMVVGAGERWGLIGASGAGKSLTAAAVAGLLPPAAHATGSVRVGDTELVGAAGSTLQRTRGRAVTLVAQDSATALHPLVPVGRQVAAPLRHLHGLTRRAAATRADDLLAEVGLPDGTARARPAQLSGGQRQRVALAAALACDADLLVADEPTAALDPTVARDLLAQLDRSIHSALLLVTHDLTALTAVCEHVAVLDHGRIVERGPVATVLTDPQHERTRALVDAARSLVPRTRPA